MEDYLVYEACGGIEGIDADIAADEAAFSAQAYEAEQAAWSAIYERDPEAEAFEAWERDRGCHLDPQSGY